MADDRAFTDKDNTAFTAALDELGNGSLSPKVSMLDGTGSPTPISPATSGNQATTNTRIGDLTETAPGTDTASSGLNGRLQRVSQRLTSLIAQFPATLGVKTAALSLSVTHASDDAVKTAVEIMDDWDESDRARVNTVVGQAGVAAGTGTISANTQRMTIATDDPMYVAIGAISASPTANTVQARLEAIRAAVAALNGTASGTAGLPSTEVLTVQGIASMTPLTIQGSASGVMVPVDGGRVRRVQIVPSIDATALAAGDVMAATEVVSNVVRANDLQGLCQKVQVADAADLKKGLTIVFFRSNVSAGAENAVASIASADVDEILDWVTFTAADYKDFGSGAVAKKATSFIVQPASGTANIFMAIIADEAADYATASDITVTLEILQD